MLTCTYVDDSFADNDIVVTVPEEVELSEAQRRTIARVAGRLDNEVCFALIDDQNCVMLPADDGRYGFEYFTSCVNDQIEGYEHRSSDFRLGYIGGEGLPAVSDDLIRLISPAYCPEMLAAMGERDLPVDVQLQQREKVREVCAEYLAPLAMVMPEEPVFHEEYDERKAAWTEEDDYYEEDYYYDEIDGAKEGTAAATKMYTSILHGEFAAVIDLDEEKSWTDMDDLREEMLDDLWMLEAECDDEMAGLAADADADKSESHEARIAEIKEKYDHARSIRRRAFEFFCRLRLGDIVESGELVEEIRRYYSRYVTLESGSRAVRLLLEREGFNPERDIEETDAMLDALRKDSASVQDGSGPQRDLANLEGIHGLLSELLAMEEAERRAEEEEAERQRMRLCTGNTLLVTGGPFAGRSVLVREVDPRGRFAVVELEIMGRKVDVRIAEGDLRHS